MKLTEYANAINKDLKMTYLANQENPWRLIMVGLEISEDHCLVSKFGWGNTPDEAIKDYSVVISGQPIVFGAHTDKRVEFTVPALTF